jgi:DNA damage-binding protein 2
MLQHDLTLFRIDTTNDGMVYTASSDGTISFTDLDTGIGSPLLNLNPNGWNVSLLSGHVL